MAKKDEANPGMTEGAEAPAHKGKKPKKTYN